MGVIRCQNLARQSVYWPNIYNDIANIVSNCETCLRYQNANTRPELMPHETVSVPWYKVGADIFEFRGRIYILVVDYYSTFVELELLNEGYTAIKVIGKLKSIFARHGIPYIFVSDNGPPFSSREFKTFCGDWGIDHKTSSPYLPRSNGLAERTIQTVKKLFLKSLEDGSDPYIALLHYRTTRKGDLPSPSELLMSRSLRTKIPSLVDNYTPKLVNTEEYSKKLDLNIKKCSEYYNRKSRIPKSVKEGDKIMFKRTPPGPWLHGEVVGVARVPRSYVVLDDKGSTYRRSLEHIRKSPRKEENFDSLSSNRSGEDQGDAHNMGDKEEEVGQHSTETHNRDQQYVTKRGRIVKRPEKLDL